MEAGPLERQQVLILTSTPQTPIPAWQTSMVRAFSTSGTQMEIFPNQTLQVITCTSVTAGNFGMMQAPLTLLNSSAQTHRAQRATIST
jgi:hypothetical protein